MLSLVRTSCHFYICLGICCKFRFYIYIFLPKKWKQKEKQKENVNAENMSHVCGTAWELLEEHESDSFWIVCAGKTCKCKSTAACKHECDWWVHNRCVTIYYENSEAREKTWAKKHFCQKQCQIWKKLDGIRSSSRIGVPSNSKKLLKIVIQKKLNKWKFYSDLWNLLIPFISSNISITLPNLFLLWFKHPLYIS